MQLWRTARQQAEKLGFEADKLVRLKREEGAVAEVRQEQQLRLAELGAVAYRLSTEGVISHPDLASREAVIKLVEQRLAEAERRLAEVRAEQWIDARAEIGVQPGQIPQVLRDGPMRRCPHCGYTAPAYAVYCAQCSHKLEEVDREGAAAAAAPAQSSIASTGAAADELSEHKEESARESSVAICTRCRARIVPGASFCGECGAPAASSDGAAAAVD
jgi:ribosomal protein L40E